MPKTPTIDPMSAPLSEVVGLLFEAAGFVRTDDEKGSHWSDKSGSPVLSIQDTEQLITVHKPEGTEVNAYYLVSLCARVMAAVLARETGE